MLPNPEIYGFTLKWYYFFHWLGVTIATFFGIWYYRNKSNFKLSIWQICGFFLILYVLLMFGGRLVGMMEVYLRENRLVGLDFFLKGPSFGMFRWCGSLLLVLIALPFFAKKILRIITFNAFFDMLALSFCVLTVFTKQGCQFSGDGCYGIPTTLPWGMHYIYGDVPSILPVHPTPIYDTLFHCVLFILLLRWDIKYKQYAGQTAFIYFIGASVFYILLEMLRLNPVIAFGITLPQLIYSLIIMFGLFYLFKIKQGIDLI